MAGQFEHGMRVRPFLGERVSGDAGLILEEPDGLFIAIIDVLGHGPEAHEVANLVVEQLQTQDRSDLCAALQRLHESLLGSRGAAVALARVNSETGILAYSGIGNTVIRKIGRESVRLVTRDGTLGHIMRTPREEKLKIEKDDVVLLYTDGIQDHFDLDRYPALKRDSAGAIARNIVRLFGKPHDDATCIALRAAR